MTNNLSNIIKFAIGVTGHRDCDEAALPAIKESVSSSLANLKSRFSNTTVEVICGLAEGADCVVAQAALDLGISVQAILPMPLNLYRQDFSESGLATLELLISNPNVTVTEIPVGTDNDLNRDRQYVLLKDYIVRRSNILLALWDNLVTGLPGGTADTVLEYLAEDCTAPYSVSETEVSRTSRMAFDDDGNLVISIHTPRSGKPSTGNTGQVSYLVSEGAPNALAEMEMLPPRIEDRWRGLDGYVLERQSDYARELQSWDMYTEGDAEKDVILPDINEEFVRADQLAMANQKFSDMLFKGFGLAAGAMGFTFLAYAKLAAINTFLIIYLCLFVAGYCLFKLSVSRGWFAKHLSYRALAETLRVRYYLTLSGISGDVQSGPLLKASNINRFKGIEWLYDVVRCAEPLLANRETSDGVDVVKTRWIDDQSGYFTKKLHTLHHQHSRLEKVKGVLFFSSFAGIVALLFFKKDLYHLHLLGTDGKTLLVFLMGLLPLWLALWELYQSKMAVRELSWQYANQQHIFAEASRRMSEPMEPSSHKAIVADLASRSLSEIFQWTAQRFHREHEPPSAG